MLLSAAWQRCRDCFLRNVLAQVAEGSAEMATEAIRTVFAQPGPAAVREQLGVITGMLGRQFPKVEAMLLDAADDITAFVGSPKVTGRRSGHQPAMAEQGDQAPHQRRRVFPNSDALLRLAGAVLVEAHDEWQVGERRYLSEGSIALFARSAANPEEVATAALLTA